MSIVILTIKGNSSWSQLKLNNNWDCSFPALWNKSQHIWNTSKPATLTFACLYTRIIQGFVESFHGTSTLLSYHNSSGTKEKKYTTKDFWLLVKQDIETQAFFNPVLKHDMKWHHLPSIFHICINASSYWWWHSQGVPTVQDVDPTFTWCINQVRSPWCHIQVCYLLLSWHEKILFKSLQLVFTALRWST